MKVSCRPVHSLIYSNILVTLHIRNRTSRVTASRKKPPPENMRSHWMGDYYSDMVDASSLIVNLQLRTNTLHERKVDCRTCEVPWETI